MFRKHCPHCDQVSYSATNSGRWICPYCNADITDEPTLPIEGQKGGGEAEESQPKRAKSED